MSDEIKDEKQNTAVPAKKANPAPLGLLGFGMTTILLNLHNSGIIGLNATVAAMGFALGGLAQIIAGIMEYRAGNTFGATAFTAYGCFWWSLVAIWLNPFGVKVSAADPTSMGFYLLLWGMFTAFMFIGALKHNTITKIVFGSLTLLFFMLALGDFTHSAFTDKNFITMAAGVVGIICGLAAVYSAVGQIVNNEYGKNVLPL